MKRKDALASIVIAGYHGDDAAAIRVYTEHRTVGYAAFQKARYTGQAMKRNGVPCTCYACAKTTTNGQTGKEGADATAEL